MNAFAIYRLPHADYATLIQQTEGEPAEYHICSELNGKRGFIIAPFEVTEQQPILLIRPDKVETVGVAGHHDDACSPDLLYPRAASMTYAIDFANYHAQLEAGVFRKIVLARCADEESEEPIAPMELFHRACELYT